MAYDAHPSAIVDPGAQVGEGTRIWHWTHVCDGAVVGADCSLAQNVFVASRAVIGDRCKIQNNVSVYEGVTLGDEVFCGPSVVFTNVKTPRAHIPRMAEHQKTRVEKGVSIGANSTIVCGIRLGRYCFIGASSLVTRDVPDHALVYGQPACQHAWVCECGHRLDNYVCRCGKRYRKAGSGLVEVGAA